MDPTFPTPVEPAGASDTPAPSPLHTLFYSEFPPPLKYHGVCPAGPQLTAISTIENVRFRGLFFFLDRWKKKCFYRKFPWSHIQVGWQPTSQTWCFDGVVYSTCILLPRSQPWKAEPHQNITATVAVCLSMHLHMLFSYIWLGKFTTEMLLFHISKKFLFTSMCGLQ